MVWVIFIKRSYQGALSLLYQCLSKFSSFYYGLRYIGPMAVGFIIIAAININKKVIKDKTILILLLFSTTCINFVKNPFVFPIVLIIGGITSIITNMEENKWNNIYSKPPWKYFLFFIYSIWEDLKKVNGIKISLRGINAAAGGLITASALIFFKNNGLFFDNIIISILTALILHKKIIPPPLVVVLTIVTGFII